MKRLVCFAVAALTLASASSAFAQSSFKVYGMLAYVSPLADSDIDVNGVTDAVKASSEFGYNFGLEFRMSSLLGLEFDYLYAKQDVEHDTEGLLGETTFQPISGTLNLHVPVGLIDVYAGPTAAYVNWGDLKVPQGGGDVKLDAEFAYGVSAGADVNITPMFAVTGGLRWLKLEVGPEDGGDPLDVNPLFARLGVAARF